MLPQYDRNHRTPEQQIQFLLQPGRMRGRYLGACLDSIRWGSQISVMYDLPLEGLISFIQTWMQHNEGNIEELWYDPDDSEKQFSKLTLPYIHYSSCPVDKNHQERIYDLEGKLHCAHVDTQEFTSNTSFGLPSFDQQSGVEKISISGLSSTEIAAERLDNTIIGTIRNPCYAIISELNIVLSLETILQRLRLPPFVFYYDNCEFNFDGWCLAGYVQKFWAQGPGKRPFFEKDKNYSLQRE